MAVAGKTGTTSNAVDRWFYWIYTPYYAATVCYGQMMDIKKQHHSGGRNPAAADLVPQ